MAGCAAAAAVAAAAGTGDVGRWTSSGPADGPLALRPATGRCSAMKAPTACACSGSRTKLCEAPLSQRPYLSSGAGAARSRTACPSSRGTTSSSRGCTTHTGTCLSPGSCTISPTSHIGPTSEATMELVCAITTSVRFVKGANSSKAPKAREDCTAFLAPLAPLACARRVAGPEPIERPHRTTCSRRKPRPCLAWFQAARATRSILSTVGS
mmetsp:Transcript_23282/g.72518  ORF Transcript_23282/g.72518 Transcript_23282/m.72518 type:complete len:211 (+) Transcript_23282:59-691(+)